MANVAGAIPVTGWAIDDVGVARVDIYRDPVAGEPNTQIYVGAASFIAGSRPDIEPPFSEYPLNYRGGWGFLVLTNMLPDLVNNRPAGGNGAFRLHAYAVDVEGLSTYLGSKRFTANNAASSRPFGSLDTPAQGGTASGNSFAVFGWALAPRSVIPTNGSTINVYVDGVNLGHPVYNNNRADISGLFPGTPTRTAQSATTSWTRPGTRTGSTPSRGSSRTALATPTVSAAGSSTSRTRRAR